MKTLLDFFDQFPARGRQRSTIPIAGDLTNRVAFVAKQGDDQKYDIRLSLTDSYRFGPPLLMGEMTGT
jgi:hypothetical protein